MKGFRGYLATALVSAVIGGGVVDALYRSFHNCVLSPDNELENRPIAVADLNRDKTPDVLSRDENGYLVITFGQSPNRYKYRESTRGEQITDTFNLTCVRGNLQRVGLNNVAEELPFPTHHWMNEFE